MKSGMIYTNWTDDTKVLKNILPYSPSPIPKYIERYIKRLDKELEASTGINPILLGKKEG